MFNLLLKRLRFYCAIFLSIVGKYDETYRQRKNNTLEKCFVSLFCSCYYALFKKLAINGNRFFQHGNNLIGLSSLLYLEENIGQVLVYWFDILNDDELLTSWIWLLNFIFSTSITNSHASKCPK